MDDDKKKHPAKFSTELYPTLIKLLEPTEGRVLDPFAGIGRIHDLHPLTTGIELEPEWANQHPKTRVGSALELPFKAGTFGAICTSPCYGNRMADTYLDHSIRNTYTSHLGRIPSEDSSAVLQWGKKYRIFHELAWAEATRVTRKKNARFVLNTKNHIRNGEIMPVTEWHLATLKDLGWRLRRVIPVECPGNRQGENHEHRIDFETVALLTR